MYSDTTRYAILSTRDFSSQVQYGEVYAVYIS